MKIRLLPVLVIISIAAGAFAQKPAKTPLSTAQKFIVKKQQLVDDFEIQLRDIPYAAVRIYIRYKLAEWLWKKGKDDTDRAETLAVKALEEAHARKDELANSHRYKLVSDIFGLLDTNAKETSARLKVKYELDADTDLFSSFSQLIKKDGDQAVAQKLLKALARPGDINNLVNPLLNSLRTMKSPQFPLVLGAVLDGVESGRVNVSNPTLYMFLVNFDDPQAPPAMRARYFALVVDRARIAANKSDPVVYQLLTAAIDSFGEGSPELLPEAMGLKNALAVSETAANKERREAQERVDASEDKLAAMIEEAEKTRIRDIKYSFYLKAEGLAKNSGRLAIGIEVVEKLKEQDTSDFIKDWADQEYADIATRAFEKDEVEMAVRCIERVEDPIDRAEAWKNAAGYYHGKKDLPAARDAVGKMLKLLADGDKENGLRAHALVRAFPVVQNIDRLSVPEAIAVTARAINELPTPGVEDKPGTKKYADYVFATMWINYSLAVATTVLLSRDKTDASDLAERIQKREVRVVADLVLATDALETAQKEAEKKVAEKKAPAKPK